MYQSLYVQAQTIVGIVKPQAMKFYMHNFKGMSGFTFKMGQIGWSDSQFSSELNEFSCGAYTYCIYTMEYALGCPRVYCWWNSGWNQVASGVLPGLDISVVEPQLF
jgi:hypothetical protein